ncbi:hypothetical protein Gohar_004214 [Gossypium harknessii]|uniref:Uncharacterized protein n=1 Tax=Gossypium harknessii TaxID=34285 RepID=A0A7J9H4F4_9ROSI|nr:hypothetical protein [Gossypium harknessii]
MAEIRDCLRQTHQPNSALQSPFHALDPISLILSLNSSPSNPIPLRLTTESYIMERGPRYGAYAQLRETRLRMKSGKQQEREETEFKQTPKKKLVKFSSSLGISRQGSPVLGQSEPDVTASLRKENRKPRVTGGIELTPSGKNWSKGNEVWLKNSRGTKSANSGEKKGRLTMARESFARVLKY